MKANVLILGFCLCVIDVFAQQLSFQCSQCDTIYDTSLYEKITQIESRLNKMHLSLNTQLTFNVYPGVDTLQGVFQINQLRIEAMGNITDKIFYRYRQQLNRQNEPFLLDNMPGSIDYAAIGMHVTDRFSFFAGKQSPIYGGFEYYKNPSEVYQYCTFLQYLPSGMTGVDFTYWLNDDNEFHFQVMNSRNASFENFFGVMQEGIEQTKTPLGYTLAWNGNFLRSKVRTRWSMSVLHDAKKRNTYYMALGTQYRERNWRVFYDFMCSYEGIDREGIVSRIANANGYDYRALDTRYIAMVLFGEIRLQKSWNVFLKMMYETANVTSKNGEYEKGKYLESPSYLIGVQYFPTNENLHIFLAYSNTNNLYKNAARYFDVHNRHFNRLELGLIYEIPMF